MVNHGSPWLTIVDHGEPWLTMVSNGEPSFTMVKHVSPWMVGWSDCRTVAQWDGQTVGRSTRSPCRDILGMHLAISVCQRYLVLILQIHRHIQLFLLLGFSSLLIWPTYVQNVGRMPIAISLIWTPLTNHWTSTPSTFFWLPDSASF